MADAQNVEIDDLEALEDQNDYTWGALRLRIFRVGPYLVYRTVVDSNNDIDPSPEQDTKSAYSGYRQGYGAFRGRRAVIPKEALDSDSTIQDELARTVSSI